MKKIKICMDRRFKRLIIVINDAYFGIIPDVSGLRRDKPNSDTWDILNTQGEWIGSLYDLDGDDIEITERW